MKKKKFNPFDETIKIGQVSAGTMIAGGMPGMLSKHMPGTQPTADRISNATGRVLPILPLTQGVSSVFGSLGNLQGIEKKIKKKR